MSEQVWLIDPELGNAHWYSHRSPKHFGPWILGTGVQRSATAAFAASQNAERRAAALYNSALRHQTQNLRLFSAKCPNPVRP